MSRLVGAPPGYVGYEEGGQLSEAVRRRPYCGRPPRRDRKGAPRRLQRAAAGARRRPADRRPGQDRRLHQHGADHDVEPAGRTGRLLQAGVREPHRRDRQVPSAVARADLDKIVDIQLSRLETADGRALARARGDARGPRLARELRLRPRLRGEAAEAGAPEVGRGPAGARSAWRAGSRRAQVTVDVGTSRTAVRAAGRSGLVLH